MSVIRVNIIMFKNSSNGNKFENNFSRGIDLIHTIIKLRMMGTYERHFIIHLMSLKFKNKPNHFASEVNILFNNFIIIDNIDKSIGS